MIIAYKKAEHTDISYAGCKRLRSKVYIQTDGPAPTPQQLDEVAYKMTTEHPGKYPEVAVFFFYPAQASLNGSAYAICELMKGAFPKTRVIGTGGLLLPPDGVERKTFERLENPDWTAQIPS